MMRGAFALILLFLLGLIFGACLSMPSFGADTNDKANYIDFFIKRPGGTYVVSPTQVAVYPSQEDTTGKRKTATYVGSNIWRITPDSTEVYDVYYRATCCLDTLVATLSRRHWVTTEASEKFISSSRAFVAGVVNAAAIGTAAVGADEIGADAVGTSEIASDGVAAAEIAADAVGTSEIITDGVGSDEIVADAVGASEIVAGAVGASEIADASITGTELARSGSPSATNFGTSGGGPDTLVVKHLRVNQLQIQDGFNVQTAIGPSTIQGPLIIDGATNLLQTTNGADADFDDALNVDGTTTLNGTVELGNSIGDQINVQGDLNTQDDMFFGNGSGDDATFTGTVSTQGAVNLGNDAADLTTAQDLTVADDATVTDAFTANGAGNLGDNAADVWAMTAAFTHEGKATHEDSLIVGTDFTAADSTKHSFRLAEGHFHGSADMFVSATLLSGSTTQTVLLPGVDSNDFISYQVTSPGTGAPPSTFWFTSATGRIFATRHTSVGDCTITIMVTKR